ncbi:hypothetical protein [Agrobacterium sp. LAD9]|uniref:hypothetical protein n=1 Tax=Agrobacterium sp. LAD9 TaxID=2055153 RepID=UPI000D1E3EE4|nr:hypothetical protein [Agrobacterium sp. LAD9]
MMRSVSSNAPAEKAPFNSAELFNCCTALQEPEWRRFSNLELGGCIDAAQEGMDGTCIEGGKSRDKAEFFTVYGHLIEGGCEAITDCDDFDGAQRVAIHLCGLSGLTLEIVC